MKSHKVSGAYPKSFRNNLNLNLPLVNMTPPPRRLNRIKVYYNNAINLRYRDWDQVQYLWTGMALGEFFFFECLYFSEHNIRICYLFFGWEIGHPLSTYATGGMEGDHLKCVQVRTGRRGVKLPNNLGLKMYGKEELLRLFTWVFIDLMIRGFDLVTYGFELVTHGFELVTRVFELALFNFNSCF